ncbi:MAG: hypothetical protein DRN59_03820 [Thaumarchaeota archaeon]|nr:MAG: hypothetical protein DRN59_03820 [Nitrososphaerota archaeon]
MSLTYLICRAHGYASRLLGRELILELASTQSLQQLVERLATTEYGEKLKTARTLMEMENAITEVFLNRLRSLLKVAGESRGIDFLKSYLRRYEVQNIIWILRMRLGKASKEEASKLLIPIEEISEVKIEDILEAEDLTQALEIIKRSKAYRLPKTINSLLELEAELWKNYYSRVFERTSRVPAGDRVEIRKLLGLEIELINLRTCILSAIKRLDRSIAERMLIENPAGTSRRKLRHFLESYDEKFYLEHFPAYRSYLEKLISGEEPFAEIERLRILKRFADKRRIPRFISFFYVIKYLLDLEAEYRDLRAILISIHHNIPNDVKLRLLINS